VFKPKNYCGKTMDANKCYEKNDLYDTVECLYEYKRKIYKKVVREINDSEKINAALKDGHAKRVPRPCGLTIHPGFGCSFGCVYCYIYPMGFSRKPVPNPLTPQQLELSLATNPYFVPGFRGTLIAVGSVTEPFVTKEIAEKTIAYMKAIDDVYNNPVQVATKSTLIQSFITVLKQMRQKVSILVSLISIKWSRKLEPGAPDPMQRFELIEKMVGNGIPAYLFLRPIIPGVTDSELKEILLRAKEAGASGIVYGSLRVTESILSNLEKAGIDSRLIRERVMGEVRGDSKQVPVRTDDIKMRIRRFASKMGLRAFPSSCAANIDAHGLSCYRCSFGPCGSIDNLPMIDPDNVRNMLSFFGINVHNIKISNDRITLKGVSGKDGSWRVGLHWLETITKRRVVVLKR
jgi:DNA repair photolyase